MSQDSKIIKFLKISNNYLLKILEISKITIKKTVKTNHKKIVLNSQILSHQHIQIKVKNLTYSDLLHPKIIKDICHIKNPKINHLIMI